MPISRPALVLAGLLSLWTGDAIAEDATPVCPVAPVLSPELAGWVNKTPLIGTSLPLSGAVTAPLSLHTEVTFQPAPDKAPDPAGFGGVFQLEIPTAGTYGLAAGSAVWIEVVRDDKALTAASFGHGPDCSGIRKIVWFALEPGVYRVQIVNGRAATVDLMVISPAPIAP